MSGRSNDLLVKQSYLFLFYSTILLSHVGTMEDKCNRGLHVQYFFEILNLQHVKCYRSVLFKQGRLEMVKDAYKLDKVPNSRCISVLDSLIKLN